MVCMVFFQSSTLIRTVICALNLRYSQHLFSGQWAIYICNCRSVFFLSFLFNKSLYETVLFMYIKGSKELVRNVFHYIGSIEKFNY